MPYLVAPKSAREFSSFPSWWTEKTKLTGGIQYVSPLPPYSYLKIRFLPPKKQAVSLSPVDPPKVSRNNPWKTSDFDGGKHSYCAFLGYEVVSRKQSCRTTPPPYSSETSWDKLKTRYVIKPLLHILTECWFAFLRKSHGWAFLLCLWPSKGHFLKVLPDYSCAHSCVSGFKRGKPGFQ